MATMAANATSTSAMHYSPDLVNMTESSMELTKRFAQMQLKSATCIPKRQPTIVCEDIADDDEFLDQEGDNGNKEDSKNESLLLRSASSASLSVPVICEDEISEKRRPPLSSALDH